MNVKINERQMWESVLHNPSSEPEDKARARAELEAMETWEEPLGEPCLYCGETKYITEGRNSLSRWLTDTYICPKCGDFEAFVDLYRKGAKLVFAGTSLYVGVAVEGRAGYMPLAGDRARLTDYKQACQIAESLNRKLREPVDEQEALRVIATTIRAQHIGY